MIAYAQIKEAILLASFSLGPSWPRRAWPKSWASASAHPQGPGAAVTGELLSPISPLMVTMWRIFPSVTFWKSTNCGRFWSPLWFRPPWSPSPAGIGGLRGILDRAADGVGPGGDHVDLVESIASFTTPLTVNTTISVSPMSWSTWTSMCSVSWFISCPSVRPSWPPLMQSTIDFGRHDREDMAAAVDLMRRHVGRFPRCVGGCFGASAGTDRLRGLV